MPNVFGRGCAEAIKLTEGDPRRNMSVQIGAQISSQPFSNSACISAFIFAIAASSISE